MMALARLPALARRVATATVASLAIGMAGAAHAQSASPADPFESFNRAVFSFNESLDRAVLKPVAETYVQVTPELFRYLFRSLIGNLLEPWNAFNNLLQGKPVAAASDISRLVVNVAFTFGLADLASDMGFERSNEDLGQTFGVWGAGPGPYLVLPILGPSSVRDGLGRIGDIGFDPSRRISSGRDFAEFTVARITEQRASLLSAERVVEGAALDRYSFIRNAYLQRRLNLIYDGNPPEPKE